MQRMSFFLRTVLALCCCVATTANAGIVLNEVRIDDVYVPDDVEDYLELAGPRNASLNGLTVLVIGSQGSSGVIEFAQSLDGYAIPSDGAFLIAASTFGTKYHYDPLHSSAPDIVIPGLNFNTEEDLSFLLVRGFSGYLGEDLDTVDAANDPTLDIHPWTQIVDGFAITTGLPNLFNPPYGGINYGDSLGIPTFGPDPFFGVPFPPARIYRSVDITGPFVMGSLFFDGESETPGYISVPEVSSSILSALVVAIVSGAYFVRRRSTRSA